MRVTDPSDPRRCQFSFPHEQCWNETVCETSKYCLVHDHGKTDPEAHGRRMYFLTESRHRARLAELAEHEEIKSLREDIGLARMMIEERFRLIKTDAELLASFPAVNQYLLTIDRLVKTTHQIEQTLGSILEKPTVLRIGQQICDIVVRELEGVPNFEAIVDRITTRIINTIADAMNDEHEDD